MNAPKPASSPLVEDEPAVAALDNAPEEPLTEEEGAAFEDALAQGSTGVTSEELLERLRSKP